MTRFSSRRYSTQRLQYFRVNIPNGIYLSRQLYRWNRKIMPKLIISFLVLKKIRIYIKYKSSYQRAILRFYHVKTLSLARQKRARQTKIYSVHFHGVRSFSLLYSYCKSHAIGTKLDVFGLYFCFDSFKYINFNLKITLPLLLSEQTSVLGYFSR